MTKNVIPMKANDPINTAVQQLSKDAGALFEPAILEKLKEMRNADPARFQRIRQQVKEAKTASMAEFDRLTYPDKEKSGSSASIFPDVEPWSEPVNGAELLDDLVVILQRHVIADKETLRAAALWSVFTWLLDSVQISPIANITAPEPRCGKTILLSALGKLVCRPLQVSDIATAALFRSMELWSPTLLIDEVDAFLRDNEESRGILNAGFAREGAFVIRCVGDDHMPTKFNVWGARALCGIGKIAATLADRSIPLRMRRKNPGERAERLRHSNPLEWEQLRSRICRFAQDNAEQIAAARPSTIDGLNDRANDCWEPLLAIAGAAGGEWPGMARLAAMSLHGVEEESQSVGAELLGDIKAAFELKRATKMFTTQLLEELIADDEAPWATWNRGKEMTPRQLSAKLSDFGIKSGTVRIGAVTKKGYSREQFEDAFSRYLSSATSVTPSHASKDAASGDFQSVTRHAGVTERKALKAPEYKGCDGVTDETPLPPKVPVPQNSPSASETPKQTSNGAASSGFSNETAASHASQPKQLQPSNHAGCFDVSDREQVPLDAYEDKGEDI